jgi:hypothetical protein
MNQTTATAADSPLAVHAAPHVWVRTLLWPEVLVPLLAAAAVIVAAPFNCDAAWYMVAARRMLQGDRLFVDLLDTNPPLIVWLTAIPAFLSTVLNVSDRIVMHSFTAFLLVCSGLVASRILRLAPAPSRPLAFVLVAAAATGLSVPWVVTMAQREQIAAMLIFPYVLLAARAASGAETARGLGLLVGAMAAIGVGLKPFFLGPWVVIELTVLLLRRELVALKRPEVGVVVLSQAVYVLLVIALTPAYFSEIVPFARATYGAYGTTWQAVAMSRKAAVVLSIALAGLAVPSLLSVRRGRLSELLGAATLGFLLSYVVQAKGWYYQLIPALVFAACTVIAVIDATVAAARARLRDPGVPRLAMAGIAVAAMVAAAWVGPHGYRMLKMNVSVIAEGQHPAEPVLVRIVSELAPGEPIFFLSTAMWPAFPVVNDSGADWPYRYPFLWPLPGFYPGRPGERVAYRPPARQSPLERRFFEAVVSDMTATPPRLLFVERGPNQQAMEGRDFDFIQYFSGSPDFRQLFARYRSHGRVGAWDVYLLSR